MTTRTPVVAIAVLAGLLTSVASADAQIGLTAGVARSMQGRHGLTAGVSLFLPTSRAGGWQVEALLIEKGAENLLQHDDTLRVTYLEIPALLHLDVLRRRRNAVYLLVGPALAFALRASYESDGAREDIKDDVTRVDVGLHVGAGVEFGQATVDARYVWGGRTVFDDGGLDATFRNRGFTVMAGFRFGR